MKYSAWHPTQDYQVWAIWRPLRSHQYCSTPDEACDRGKTFICIKFFYWFLHQGRTVLHVYNVCHYRYSSTFTFSSHLPQPHVPSLHIHIHSLGRWSPTPATWCEPPAVVRGSSMLDYQYIASHPTQDCWVWGLEETSNCNCHCICCGTFTISSFLHQLQVTPAIQSFGIAALKPEGRTILHVYNVCQYGYSSTFPCSTIWDCNIETTWGLLHCNRMINHYQNVPILTLLHNSWKEVLL